MSQRVLVGGFTADMTPEPPVLLAGYPARTRPADERAEPLLVTAVTVRTDDGRLVLIGADCLGLDVSVAGPLRRRLAEIADADESMVHVCASNTHFAPVLSPTRSSDPECPLVEPEEAATARLFEATERAVRRAVDLETACEVSSYTARVSGFFFNRRFQTPSGETETHDTIPVFRPPLAERPIDDRMTVICFRRDDYVAATIVHCAFPQTCGIELYSASSDALHHLRRTVIEDLEGPVLFLQGASGDVAPVSRGREARTVIGRSLGDAVRVNLPRLAQGIDMSVEAEADAQSEVHVVSRKEAVPVLRPHVAEDPAGDLAKAAAESQTHDPHSPEGLHRWSDVSAAFFRRIYPDGIMHVELSRVRIGSLTFVFLPFELVSSLSLELSAEYPSARLVSCSNGFQGYLLSEDEIRSGGLEARPGSRHLDGPASEELLAVVRSLARP